MWSEQNEKEFQALIEKYQENPSNPIDKEIDLIQHLMECYIEADLKPGSEIIFFKKLTVFYNIFLESYLKAHPDIFKDKATLDETLKAFPFEKSYPFLVILKEMLAKKEKNQNIRSTYNAFVKPLDGLLDKQEKEFLDPYSLYSSPYANPKQNPKDITTLPYNEMVQEIFNNIKEKQKLELNLTKERNLLVCAYYRYYRIRALRGLTSLYQFLDVTMLAHIPHIAYNTRRTPSFYLEYPGSFIRDILPHPTFSTVGKLIFRHARAENKMFLAALLGKILSEELQAFSGFKVFPKTAGKDPGFILVSPKNKKHYVKHTDNLISEYFCSKVLSHLGIKMPEAQLLVDAHGNQFYVTLDVSRKYTKNQCLKTKEFQPLSEELEKAPQAAFGFDIRKGEPSKEEQEKIVQNFLKEVALSKEAKKSFAKILLAWAAFGLADLGCHGGNVGIIRVQNGETHYIKFGMVDFQFEPMDITNELNNDVLKYLEQNTIRFIPIFRKIFEILSPKDFLTATKELENPKERTYTKEGLLFANSPLTRTPSRKVIESTFKEVVTELQVKLPPKEYKDQIESLEVRKNIMIKNLEALIGSFRELNLKKEKPITILH